MRRPRFIEVKPASLRGKQRTRRTEYFGGKLLGVGRNSFARPKKLNDAGGNSRSGFYARTLKRGDQIRKRPPSTTLVRVRRAD
jgi:hypothetical protein